MGPNNGVGSSNIEKYLTNTSVDVDLVKQLTRKLSMINIDTDSLILDDKTKKGAKKYYRDDELKNLDKKKKEIPTLIRLCEQGEWETGNMGLSNITSDLDGIDKKCIFLI